MTRSSTPALDPPADVTDEQATLWRALIAERRAQLGAQAPLGAAGVLALRAVVDVARRLDQVRARIDADGMMISGSTGQLKAHPLIGIEASLRAELVDALTRWHGK